MSRDVSLRDRPDLARIVTDEFPDNPPASVMIDAFLRHRHAYRADFVDDLVSASREASRPWELRRLAWDRAVAIYLRNSESADWRVEAEAMLAVEGLPEDVRRRFLKAIDEFSGFLKRFSFLMT